MAARLIVDDLCDEAVVWDGDVGLEANGDAWCGADARGSTNTDGCLFEERSQKWIDCAL